MNRSSYMSMQNYYDAIRRFHEKFEMKGTNGEDMQFRLNLMIEELGELAQAITRGKTREEVVEENVDLFNLILGNLISLEIPLEEFDKAFWKKHEKIMNRKVKDVNGRFRVSHFGDETLK